MDKKIIDIKTKQPVAPKPKMRKGVEFLANLRAKQQASRKKIEGNPWPTIHGLVEQNKNLSGTIDAIALVANDEAPGMNVGLWTADKKAAMQLETIRKLIKQLKR